MPHKEPPLVPKLHILEIGNYVRSSNNKIMTHILDPSVVMAVSMSGSVLLGSQGKVSAILSSCSIAMRAAWS